ncbi:MAG: FIST C-terminal domain-containing protein [Deltaproteobacteria bacterium]|nr:FIST C-terminal domain-containing protein [Deltaproteobacteria bacterium]
MNVKTAYSTKETAPEAVEELRAAFAGFDAKALIYFASPRFEPAVLSGRMQEIFGEIPVFGCTSSGEIVSGHMLDQSIVAMALNDRMIDAIHVETLTNLKADPKGAVERAFRSFETRFGIPVAAMDHRKYVGLVLIDGLSGMEEKVMERIGDLTDIQFVGGSAGDDLKFRQTHVFSGGKALTDAAVVVLMKMATGFDFIKTQSFSVLDKCFTATKVNEASREVVEFDHRPALEVYAEALGTTPDKASDFFMSNPVGLMMGEEPYVRSPQRVQGTSLIFYCNIAEGMELCLLRSEDIVEGTRRDLDRKLKEMGSISGIINFNCILRTLELKQNQMTEPYGRLFANIPTVGFSTYGEEYFGHINQTATMLVIK